MHKPEGRYVGSTGATGFALTALCIGAERGWISRHAARAAARRTLHSYAAGPVANVHGWFYHFLDIRSGVRYRTSEVSTSDSTWLVAGALTARQYFQEDPQIVEPATTIYERMDYRWSSTSIRSFSRMAGHPKPDSFRIATAGRRGPGDWTDRWFRVPPRAP